MAVILAVIIILSLSKDLIIKIFVEKGVRAATGLNMGIRYFHAGIFRSAVSIRGLRIYNPPQFKDVVMADLPEIYVSYDLPAILRGKLHLRVLRIHLKKFVVVKNAAGELNLNALKVVKAGGAGAVSAGAEKGSPPNILIDSFELKIEKAYYKDYTTPGKPSIREYAVDLNERYSDVDDPYAVVSIIVVKTLSSTSIGSLASFDTEALRRNVVQSLSSAHDMAGKAVGAIGDIFKDTLRPDKR